MGQPVDATQAKQWGLVNRVVNDGKALETAIALGKAIASFPQQTVKTDRAAVYDGVGESLEKGLRIKAWHGRRALATALEGAERFSDGGRHGTGIEDTETH